MSNNGCRWIRQIQSLNEIERAQMQDQFPFVAIDDVLAFDLVEWTKAEGWKANTMPALKKGEANRLRDSVTRYGVLDNLLIDTSDGWVADGNHRLQFYHEARGAGLSVPFAGFTVRKFADEHEREAYQATRTFAGRAPNTRMKRAAARRLICRHPDWADNRIACEIGIDQGTVTSVSDEMIAQREISPRPNIRIDAAGREIDVSKLKKKAKKDCAAKASHPLLSLVTAWHAARGGHGTTSAELLPIAESAGIDLVELGACKSTHDGTARLKTLSKSLGQFIGQPVGTVVITAYRQPSSGFTVFALVRGQDYRPNLDRKLVQETDESSSAETGNTTSEDPN
jgi:hypothetical protein